MCNNKIKTDSDFTRKGPKNARAIYLNQNKEKQNEPEHFGFWCGFRSFCALEVRVASQSFVYFKALSEDMRELRNDGSFQIPKLVGEPLLR